MEEKKITEEAIERYLYGYKEMRLISSDELFNILQKDTTRPTNITPPLSPRKIRVPEDISLCSSSIPGNQYGACAIKRIAHGAWYGPFEGKLVRTTEVLGANSEYMWEIFHDGEVSHYLDGYNEWNWMAFVRCARHKKEQNMVVFQYHGCIYYRTIKDIPPGHELLVWYDGKYTQLLGIPLAWNDNRGTSYKRRPPGQNTDEISRRRRDKISPIPMLQEMESKWLQEVSTLQQHRKQIELREPPSLVAPSLDLSPSLPITRCQKCFTSFNSPEQLSLHKCFPSSWVSARSSRFASATTKLYQHLLPSTSAAASASSSTSTATDLASLYQTYCQRYQRPSPPIDFSCLRN